MSTLGSTVLLVLQCWTAILIGGALGAAGRGWAAAGAFSACCALVLRVRPRIAFGRASPSIVGFGFLCGLTTYAAWTTTITWLGLALGLTPLEGPIVRSPLGWLDAVAIVALAPCFEEILYRGHLDRALAGWPPLLRWCTCSACFALPHGTPWAWLGTFLVGLGLGMARSRGASVALCVAVHAGLNVAALFGDARLTGWLPFGFGVVCFAAAISLCRVEGRGGLLHVG